MPHQQVSQLLHEIEQELKQLSLWQSEQPPASTLRSQQPFAVDTLAFHQWLQFIMIPRMHSMVAARQPLPSQVAISPMAAQVYKGQLKQHRLLIGHLRRLDIVLSGKDPLQPDDTSV